MVSEIDPVSLPNCSLAIKPVALYSRLRIPGVFFTLFLSITDVFAKNFILGVC